MAQSTASLLVAAAAAGAAAAYLVCKALAVKAPVAGDAAIAARVQEAAKALIRAPTAAAKTFPVIAKAAKQKRAWGTPPSCLRFAAGALSISPPASPPFSFMTPSPPTRPIPTLQQNAGILVTGGAGFVGSNLVDALMLQVRGRAAAGLARAGGVGGAREARLLYLFPHTPVPLFPPPNRATSCT